VPRTGRAWPEAVRTGDYDRLIYISIIQVDFATLVAMIAASVLGAWLGARVPLAAGPDPGRDGLCVARGGGADADNAAPAGAPGGNCPGPAGQRSRRRPGGQLFALAGISAVLIVVVIYAAATMLRSAFVERGAPSRAASAG